MSVIKELVDSFNWNSNERVSDRYGAFMVADGSKYKDLEGKQVKVTATVKEVKECHHIGDLFHGFVHTVPVVGESHVLSVGKLRVEDNSLAIEPSDGRGHFWINPMVLYRLCQQGVEIEVQETTDSDSVYPFWIIDGSTEPTPKWFEDAVAKDQKRSS